MHFTGLTHTKFSEKPKTLKLLNLIAILLNLVTLRYYITNKRPHNKPYGTVHCTVLLHDSCHNYVSLMHAMMGKETNCWPFAMEVSYACNTYI